MSDTSMVNTSFPQEDELQAAAYSIGLSVKGFGLVLLSASLLVIGLGIASEVYLSTYGTETVLKDLRHFSLNGEYCLPAWYSTALLLCAGLLAGGVAATTLQHKRRWTFAALLAIGMSLDEASGFHEVLIEPLRDGLGLSGIFYFAWVLVGMALVVTVGMLLFPLFLALSNGFKVLYGLAAALYLVGALGMEMVGGLVIGAVGEGSALYIATYTVEESLEILGLTLLVVTLLAHLRSRAMPLTLSIR